ncbi:aldehyde dehydrogenase family protein, partial [Reinekea sp.]
GVIGIIAPWNYPLLLTLGPLIGALAAGNHVLIKPSELSPEFGRLLARLIDQYFDAGLVAVVNGDVALAQNFSALPFQHLVFTGSVEVGRAVMRAASDNLTPVTLELGGKSPVVIDRSMPVREAAERLVFAKCLNAGQTCVAPDYILCPDDQVSDFVQHFLSEAKRQYGDITQNDDYTAIINQAQRKRLIAYVDEAKAAGALVFVAGPSDELDYYGNKLPPILLTNVPEGSRLLEDEIFGPLLPIIKYHSLDEALNYINDRPQPLALYVFGYEQQLRPLFSRKTHSGALMFNEAVIHVGMPNLPFGGVGNSGMGHYHGRYGFETFSKLKPIIVKQRLSSLKLLYPPYKSWLVNLILRVFGR